MQKTCKKCSSNFEITKENLEFYKKVSPKFDGKIYEISTPTMCPDCRQQRRLSFRNERNLYKRKCDATGETMISIYSPDKPYKVYDSKIWWGDSWDALDYGVDFDFEKGFFEQFGELMKKVPTIGLFINDSMKESQYTNYGAFSKNVYMGFVSFHSSNIFYSYTSVFCNNDVDGFLNNGCENTYECVTCRNSYNLFYSKDSKKCNNSYYLTNCINCEYCFGCVNLLNMKYCILNKQYSKKDYFEIIKEIQCNGLKKFEKDLFFLKMKKPNKFIQGINIENSTGDNLTNCINCKNCFDFNEGKNCNYFYSGGGKNVIDDNYDIYMGGDMILKSYENIGIINVSKVLFSNYIVDGKNLFYCNSCVNNCSNCFGCIGLKNKEYCILNKQYTKEEYNKLVPKIIEKMKETGEWGEFFPSSLSPFGYNETVAQEYFPLSRDVALLHLYNWSDYESPKPNVEKIIPAEKLPENISDIPDDILNWAIKCEVSGKPFRIISQELEFYRKHNLPIPRKHPDIRHLERMRLRNPRKLFDRKCDKCGEDMKSTYAHDREEIVYCEGCYEKEVY